MAGLFKRKVGTTTRGPRVQEGIDNLKKQPAKGILKHTEPEIDYNVEPPIDYDSGYESEPPPDYDLNEGKDRARDNWNKLINKFKQAVIPEHAPGKLNDAIADSVRIKIIDHNSKLGDEHLQEVSQGKFTRGPMVFEVLHMNPKELESHKLTYDKRTGSLLDFKGKTASTIGKESKSMLDVQAFVMSKEGDIYVGTHKNQYLLNTKNLVHGSFLSGRPAETAGVIRVNKKGKIDYINNNSGHYQPEAIDMYRGIKKIQETMPGALDKDCIIYLHTKPHPIFINDFIKDMETKDRFGSKTYYEKLREERIAKITKLPPKSTTEFV